MDNVHRMEKATKRRDEEDKGIRDKRRQRLNVPKPNQA